MIESKTTMVPVDSIVCSREHRQRSNIDQAKIRDLAEAIAAQGLIHTILAERDTNKLIAGEHRLLAFKYNQETSCECSHPSYDNWTRIPVRYAYNVTPEELEALELLENMKRVQMSWQDESLAVLRYHRLQESIDPEWGVNRTAEALGLSSATASKYITIGRELDNSNPKVCAVSRMSAAYNIIQRTNNRAIQNELATLSSVPSPVQTLPQTSRAEIPAPDPLVAPILTEDFCSWAPTYSGAKFNFLHCDFPYGIGHDKSGQGNAAVMGEYDDSPETYWKLCTVLCENLDRILSHSAHIIFWLAGNHEIHEATRQFFAANAPSLEINPRPLIWHKSDSKCILPDPTYGPRYTYETALFMSRGNRQIVSAIANSYAAPTGHNRIHTSEKPEPMLRHFFRMVVDEHTAMLDPTCGSGAALRAANSLGAKSILGLELNGEFAEDARAAYTRAAKLAQFSSSHEG